MPARVMVVDDTDHVRTMLHRMLELDGFEVVGDAADGPGALAALDEADPDVMVIDYMMPGMDGLELARRVRERRPAQVMILYTAFYDEALAETAAEIGIDVCLAKVEGLESLEREISRLAATII